MARKESPGAETGKLDLKKEIGDSQISLVIIPGETYSEDLNKIYRYLNENYKRISYVSLNKINNILIKTLEKSGVDAKKFYFVDAISRTIMPNIASTSTCAYVSSPSALTELNITINKSLDTKQFDTVLFDSLSTLLIYNDPATVTKFIHGLIGKIRAVGCTSILTSLEGDSGSMAIKDLGMFVDKVIRTKKPAPGEDSMEKTGMPKKERGSEKNE